MHSGHPELRNHSLTVAQRTRLRVTRRFIPYLMLAYLLAYIDRANLAIAKLQMQIDLKFDDAIIGFAAGIFFVGYFLLEVPGALIVERRSARKWLARIMVSWGLVAALTGFVQTAPVAGFTPKQQFYAARFLLGAAEAGFFPGIIVYLSHWFAFEDRARAKAYFMMTQPLAIILGLPLARWILERVHWHGLASWRWVFILEGLPSILLGIVTWFYLTDHPSDAEWLPRDEKRWLIDRLQAEAQARAALNRVRLADAFREPSVLLLIGVYFLIISGNQALVFFFPSITNQMKSFSVPARTAITVLPYMCSIAGILLNGFSAHRTGERRWHTAIPMLLTSVALALAILSGDHLALAIAFFCLAGAASQAYLPVFWTVPAALLGSSAAAAAIGLINSCGNLGGFLGPYLFGYLANTTGRFSTGLWFLVACTALAGVLASRLRVAAGPPANNQSDDYASETKT